MPTLAEGLAAAVLRRREQAALAQADRERRQTIERLELAERHLATLYTAVGAERVVHTSPPHHVIAAASQTTKTMTDYLVLSDDGIGVAVELWPAAGTEHEENRAHLMTVCALCDQFMAVPVHGSDAGAWADARMVDRHRADVACDEPF